VLGHELGGAAALGGRVIPLHDQRAQASLHIRDRVADDGGTLIHRHHGDDARLGERSLIAH
jgi:hypothetical protein